MVGIEEILEKVVPGVFLKLYTEICSRCQNEIGKFFVHIILEYSSNLHNL